LFEFVKTGGDISDENTLLIVNVDKSNPDSVGYFVTGNYGINAGTAGHISGEVPPSPAGIAGPNAVATFLAHSRVLKIVAEDLEMFSSTQHHGLP